MEAHRTSTAAGFDRREIYRPFLARLNPLASLSDLIKRDLLVRRHHDPLDAKQPPVHVALAHSAELSPGTQMALVGGIGSGKTTELAFTRKVLARHADAVNIQLDLADYTDLNRLNTGAILATVGMRLYSHIKASQTPSGAVTSAHQKLRELAFGKTKWLPFEDYEEHYHSHDEDGSDMISVRIPGLMKLRFPPLGRQVKEVKGLLQLIAAPLLEQGAQITFLIDGLDRLIKPERFREFAEQDLQALRGTQISVIVVAPLLLWYDQSRFLQDYFDLVKRIPAAAAGPKDSAFLREVLSRRGALELMDAKDIALIVKYSGGVLRDLLTLPHSAAEYAYRDDQDRIGGEHVREAVRQLGNRYLVGLGKTHRAVLRGLAKNDEFPLADSTARELLVNRQVLDYFAHGQEVFAVHPALAKVLPRPT